jgi:CO/xanthine dehydrogenase Mo-binding subunit
VLNAGTQVAIYGGSGCQGAHDHLVALADRIKAPIAHTTRAKELSLVGRPIQRGAKITSWSASQATHDLRKQLAQMFSLPLDDVRCIFVEGSGCRASSQAGRQVTARQVRGKFQ